MSLQAISEGSELSPKGYHENVSNAMTLTAKGEEIFTQIAKVAGFNVANFAVLHSFGMQAVTRSLQ